MGDRGERGEGIEGEGEGGGEGGWLCMHSQDDLTEVWHVLERGEACVVE